MYVWNPSASLFASSSLTANLKRFSLVPLGLYPWVLGCFSGAPVDIIGSYKRNSTAMLQQPFSCTTPPNPKPFLPVEADDLQAGFSSSWRLESGQRQMLGVLWGPSGFRVRGFFGALPLGFHVWGFFGVCPVGFQVWGSLECILWSFRCRVL